MSLKEQIRHRFLTFVKNRFNPIARKLIVQSSWGPFAIVRHVGRRSGKPYETPIIVQPVDHGFVFELTYGPDVDWFKNVQAAGGCALRWHKKDYVINKIEPLDAETGRSAFWLPVRLIFRMVNKQHFYKMVTQA